MLHPLFLYEKNQGLTKKTSVCLKIGEENKSERADLDKNFFLVPVKWHVIGLLIAHHFSIVPFIVSECWNILGQKYVYTENYILMLVMVIIIP